MNIRAMTVAHRANLAFVGEMETMKIFAYDMRSGRLLAGSSRTQARSGRSAGWTYRWALAL